MTLRTLCFFSLSIILLNCGNKGENGRVDQTQWAESMLGIEASPYVLVKLSSNDIPRFARSYLLYEGVEEEVFHHEESLFKGPDSQLLSMSHTYAPTETDSSEIYLYGPEGLSCYSANSFKSCRPEYRRNKHSVQYTYHGQSVDRHTGDIYVRYKRTSLRYFQPDEGTYLVLPYRSQANSYQTYHADNSFLMPFVSDLAFLEQPSYPYSDRRKAAFGRLLFHDQRLSLNGRVSCGTCHQANKNFSDGKRLAEGLGQLNRRTPSIVNVVGLHSFFWDGRSPNLKEQSKAPIEAKLEHGISRGHVAAHIWHRYRSHYEANYGPFPRELANWVASRTNHGALPDPPSADISDISAFVWETIGSSDVKQQISHQASATHLSLEEFINSLGWIDNKPNQQWVHAYNSMPISTRNALNHVFDNFADSLSAYQKGIVAFESPFDQFSKRLIHTGNVQSALAATPGFGEKELIGLRLFTGKGGCHGCHNTPYFTDQRFHNIGLKQFAPKLDLGRAAVLPWGSPDRHSAVGAFKTPTLRNLGQSNAFMHDGSFVSLSGVLHHYNQLRSTPAVGQINPRLRAIRMEPDELRYIESFIKSLHSEIRDLSASSSTPGKGR